MNSDEINLEESLLNSENEVFNYMRQIEQKYFGGSETTDPHPQAGSETVGLGGAGSTETVFLNGAETTDTKLPHGLKIMGILYSSGLDAILNDTEFHKINSFDLPDTFVAHGEVDYDLLDHYTPFSFSFNDRESERSSDQEVVYFISNNIANSERFKQNFERTPKFNIFLSGVSSEGQLQRYLLKTLSSTETVEYISKFNRKNPIFYMDSISINKNKRIDNTYK